MTRPQREIENSAVQLSNSGTSYTQIALVLNGKFGLNLTRSAVGGIISRARKNGVEVTRHKSGIILSEKTLESKQNAKVKNNAKQSRPEVSAGSEDPSPATGKVDRRDGGIESVPTGIKVPAPGRCHYPFGDPRHDDFRYCGRETGSPRTIYCEPHVKETTEPRVGRKAAGQAAGISRRRLTFSLRSI